MSTVARKVTDEQNQFLLRPFEALEVKDAIFSMHPDKAPGPDGMNPAFFQAYWDIVGNEVTKTCMNYLNEGFILEELNSTHCSDPKKKPKPERLSDLRPISLCSVIYKIITKILTNRLKFVLTAVISESQSAFVPGRLITNNIMLSYEVNHYMK